MSNKLQKWTHPHAFCVPNEHGEYYLVKDVDLVLAQLTAKIDDLSVLFHHHRLTGCQLETTIKDLERLKELINEQTSKD